MSRVLIAAALAAIAVSVPASAASVFFESFEKPSIPVGSYSTYASGSTFVGDSGNTWNVGGAGIDIINSAYAPLLFPHGIQAIDLNALDKGSIDTTVSLAAGSYTLTFWLAANTGISHATRP